MAVRLLAQECPFCGLRILFHYGHLTTCLVNTSIATHSRCPDCQRPLAPDQWLIVDPLLDSLQTAVESVPEESHREG